jgi:hypothetical protein
MWEAQAYFLLAFSPLQHPLSRLTCFHRLREKKDQERGKEDDVIAGGGEGGWSPRRQQQETLPLHQSHVYCLPDRKVTIFTFLLGTIPVIFSALPFNNPQSLLVLQSDNQS